MNQGNTPLGVPDWSGNVWTVYRLGGGWEVGGGVVGHFGLLAHGPEQRPRSPNMPCWTRRWPTCRRNTRCALNFSNITDKHYYIGGYQNSSEPRDPRACRAPHP